MDKELLQKELDALSAKISERIEKAEEQIKLNGKTSDDLKGEMKTMIEEYAQKAGVAREEFDKMQADFKKMKSGIIQNVQMTPGLAERIKDHAGFKSLMAKESKSSGRIEVKAVADMTSTSALTNGTNVPVIEPTRRPGIVPVKRERVNIRDLFSVIPMSGNIYSFTQETGGEGAPTAVAEGASKPQSDNDFEQKEAPARKIAHHKKITEELLADLPALSGFLQTYGVVELMKVEDTQLLSGSGVGANLTGLASGALSDANFSGTIFADRYAVTDSVTRFDSIIAAAGLLSQNKHQPDVIMMNPADWAFALGDHDADQNYLFKQVTYQNGMPFFYGLPVVLTTAVTAGSFFIGDTNAAQIAQREGISVRFYDQNEDDAITNKITVVIEERLAFPIYYPTAWYTDTFANTIAAIQAAA